MHPSSRPVRVTLLDSIPGWGGGEKWCLQSALTLRERGHHVTLACPARSALAARGHRAGLRVWTARRLGGAWPGTILSLARHLRTERIEVLVGNVGRDMRLGAGACRLTGALLVQRRGLLRRVKAHALNRWLYRRTIRCVIVNAAAIRDRMLSGADFLDPRRFVVIPNAVDVREAPGGDGARLRAELGITAETPVAAAVGRLAPMKGLEDLLRAWGQVRGRLGRAELLVAGDGPLRGTLEELAGTLGIAGSVRFLGFREPLEDLYEAADLFVLASRRDEGCNNALLEAMGHGRAAVVTACGGLPEIVVPDETGRVVPVSDPGALAEAIGSLLSDAARRRRMGDAARERVRTHYALSGVIDQLEALLRDVRDGTFPPP